MSLTFVSVTCSGYQTTGFVSCKVRLFTSESEETLPACSVLCLDVVTDVRLELMICDKEQLICAVIPGLLKSYCMADFNPSHCILYCMAPLPTN